MALPIAALLAASVLPQWTMSTVTFGFFVSGPNQEAASPDLLQNQQAEHIANFGRLAQEGRLLMAGPLADPERRLRGIIVLKGEKPPQTSEEMKAVFGPDPFVQSGRLAFESVPWRTAEGRIKVEVSTEGIEEHTLVLLEKPDGAPDGDAAAMAGHMANLERMWKGGLLALSGPAVGPGTLKGPRVAGILICYGKDRAALQQELGKDPAIRLGAFRARLMPLWLAKGVLPEPGR